MVNNKENLKNSLIDYSTLIKSYINNQILVKDFEFKYFEKYKNDVIIYPEPFNAILGGLFSDLDMFCDDILLADYDTSKPFHDIDELELKTRVKEALLKLEKSISEMK